MNKERIEFLLRQKNIDYSKDNIVDRLTRTKDMKILDEKVQLSFIHLVRPHMRGTRFLHSLDTWWMAKIMLESLGVQDKEVEYAALLHDLGHLGHPLEDIANMRHEDYASSKVLESPIQDILTSFDVKKISDLIKGKYMGWQQDVINSAFDADRLAYLRRDMVMDGKSLNNNLYLDLLSSMYLKGNHINLDDEGVSPAIELNCIRNIMHDDIYNNSKINVWNEMIKKAVIRGGINIDKYRDCGDRDLIIDIIDDLKIKTTSNNKRYGPALKLAEYIKNKEDYISAITLSSVDMDKFDSRKLEISNDLIETRLNKLAGFDYGDIIVKMPLRESMHQRKRKIRINKSYYNLNDKIENEVREKYGFDAKEELPVVKVYCCERNEPKVKKAFYRFMS